MKKVPRRILLSLNPEWNKETVSLPWKLNQKAPHGKVKKVAEIVDDYLVSEHYLGLKPTTKRLYHYTLEKFKTIKLSRNENIFHMSAYKVDYALVDYLIKVLKYSINPSTAQSYITVMAAVWTYAIRCGAVEYNPWHRPGLRRSYERDITWTREQIDRTIQVANEKGFKLLALYILICYETAQRPWQDLRNLRWDNLKVLANGKTVLDFTISKTNTHVVMPLSDRALSAIKAHPVTSPLIFCDARGRHYSSQAMTEQLDSIREEAGISKNLKFRDLRRTAITEMAISGCSTMEIEALTGWRVPDSVLRRYARVRYQTAVNAQAKREQLHENS